MRLGEAFRNSARGERLERKMGRNVLVPFHGDKCRVIMGLSREIVGMRAREQKIVDQGKTLREYSPVVADATARIFAF